MQSIFKQSFTYFEYSEEAETKYKDIKMSFTLAWDTVNGGIDNFGEGDALHETIAHLDSPLHLQLNAKIGLEI